MHKFTFFTLMLSCMVLPSAWASHGQTPKSSRSRSHARHAALIREGASLDLTERNNTLGKRAQFDNARFSNFVAGPGACGGTYTGSDFIVALNIPQWDNGGNCFKTITIEYQGRTTQAQIVDQCTGCPEGGLDLTAGLFEFLVPGPDSINVVGIVYGSWSFGGGNSGESTSSSSTTISQTPTTSSTTVAPSPTSTTSSTTTSTLHTTTTSTTKSSSTSKATVTTLSTSTSTSTATSVTTPSTTSNGSSVLSASSTSSMIQPQSASPSASALSMLEDLTQAYLQLGAVVAAHAAGGN